MNQVCLSCLNKVTPEDKLYKSGNEVYHESCYTNKVMSKAFKYANQIKSLEPEQIVAQLYGSDKFTLTDEEKAIIKSQKSKIKFDNSKFVELDINNIFKNIGSEQIENIMNTQLDSIYDMIISKSEISNIISETPITKEDLKHLVNSTTSVAFNDYSLFESAVKSNINDDNMNEILMDKILENLPEELKTKLSNMKTQTGTFSSQEIFTNANANSNTIANTIANTNADTESDTDSDNELNNDNNLQNFDIPELD
jgi:hypothetical protein